MASSAISGVEAATAATAWPMYNTLSWAKQLLLRNLKFTMAPSPKSAIWPENWGKSAEVATARTPGRALALSVLIETMRAWA